jgi:hypothetical protein
MLIKLNGVTFNPDLIVVAFWSQDETLTVHLSQAEGGRKITLPQSDGEKLELFLAAHNLIDLDGPAFQKSAFEKTASLRAELQAREAIRGTLAASEALKAADGHLNALAGQSKRLPPDPGPAVSPPNIPVTQESVEAYRPRALGGLSIVPPTPPLSGDDFEPDPALFVAKNPRKGSGFLDNL